MTTKEWNKIRKAVNDGNLDVGSVEMYEKTELNWPKCYRRGNHKNAVEKFSLYINGLEAHYKDTVEYIHHKDIRKIYKY